MILHAQVAPYAGEVFDLGIKAIDELGNPTTASFRLTDGGTVNSPNPKVVCTHYHNKICVIGTYTGNVHV